MASSNIAAMPSIKEVFGKATGRGHYEIIRNDLVFMPEFWNFFVPVAALPLRASCYSAAGRRFLMMSRISAAAVGMLVPGP